jgi:acyl-CoA thioesterase-1
MKLLLPLALLLSAALSAQNAPPDSLKVLKEIPGLPRVLLIGDSISMGYTLPVRQLLHGRANLHRIGENAGPTSNGVRNVNAWLGTLEWHVIHFNFGLHDIKIMDGGKHQVGIEQYEKNLRAIAARLQQTGARLIFATTTPVPEGKVSPPRNPADVAAYNAAALRVMKHLGIEINDLYSLALPRLKEIQQPVNVHFTPAGSEALAAPVAEKISAALKP